MAQYNHQTIEKKWAKKWVADQVFVPDLAKADNPYYALFMFPYPSAEGLHIGNFYAFTCVDTMAKFKKLQGYQVFEPVGWDAFGIHSENYALKIGETPAKMLARTVANFRQQIQSAGLSCDWTREVNTTLPEYYKGTQWIFTQLFERGLAYQKEAFLNWCPGCKTVLADEQIESGACERCKSVPEKRQMKQWFFKITAYADRLLDGLETMDWSEITKAAQRNWIGRSEGAEVEFSINNSSFDKAQDRQFAIKVFTTRPDTLFGATYMVLAPEHELVAEITTAEQKAAVEEYVKASGAKSELERKESKEKTGVFTGAYAINPVNNEKLPIWVADYVLAGYGSGAIMAVPAHDERDWEFAKAYNLDIKRVVSPISIATWKGKVPLINIDKFVDNGFKIVAQTDNELIIEIHDLELFDQIKEEEDMSEWFVDNSFASLDDLHSQFQGNSVWTKEGRNINSGFLDGLRTVEAKKKIIAWLEAKGIGQGVINFKLRDWCISRQRYWGPPVPVVYCPHCGTVAVPEKDLPVQLPELKEGWEPAGDGRGPLAKVESFMKTTCPKCGGPAEREADVMDNFLDSAWYFFRYISPNNDQMIFDQDLGRKWLPTDLYVGGNEHAVLHLMYTRFITMALHDLGLINFDNPFKRFRANGMILKDGKKMSKSKGNVINPEEYGEKVGYDALKTYILFLGPLSEDRSFSDEGIMGARHWAERVHNLKGRIAADYADEAEVIKKLHQTIKGVADDLEELKYNTAIAKLMEMTNKLYGAPQISFAVFSRFVIMTAVFLPALAEELWEELGHSVSIFTERWPEFNADLAREDEISLVLQVNGKIRATVRVKAGIDEDEAKELAVANEQIRKWLAGQSVVKIIFVKDKLVNIVVK